MAEGPARRKRTPRSEGAAKRPAKATPARRSTSGEAKPRTPRARASADGRPPTRRRPPEDGFEPRGAGPDEGFRPPRGRAPDAGGPRARDRRTPDADRPRARGQRATDIFSSRPPRTEGGFDAGPVRRGPRPADDGDYRPRGRRPAEGFNASRGRSRDGGFAPPGARRQAPGEGYPRGRRPDTGRGAEGTGAPGWLELVSNLLHAPFGLAQSQAERLVAELVRGGQIGQREAERLLGELRGARERAGDRAQQEADRLDRFIEGRIEDILNRVNIPSRSDIERLNRSVEVLTAKVEALLSRADRP